MKTKLIFTAIVALCIATNSFAQTPVTFGLRGGVNFYNINGKNSSGDKLENKLKTGFNLGLNAEIPVGIDFYVQPGVLFTTKGSSDVYSSDDKLTLSYLEIPINFLYKPSLGTGRLIMGFGPYVAFGMGGKLKGSNNQENDVKFKNDLTTEDLVSGNVYFKGLDAGANLLFGYECSNKISVQLNAGLGLVNIAPDVEGNTVGKTSYKNTGFGVSLGYRF